MGSAGAWRAPAALLLKDASAVGKYGAIRDLIARNKGRGRGERVSWREAEGSAGQGHDVRAAATKRCAAARSEQPRRPRARAGELCSPVGLASRPRISSITRIASHTARERRCRNPPWRAGCGVTL